MKTIKKVGIGQLEQHPYHEQIYKTRSTDYLERTLVSTGSEPIYPIVVVPKLGESGRYWVTAGMNRLHAQILMGKDEVEVIVHDTTDEDEIKTLIVDLNKQREKDGFERWMEFRHVSNMYPPTKGVPGNRYQKIAAELGHSIDYSESYVKDLVMLDGFFKGDGQSVLESVFSGSGLSVNQANTLMSVVKEYPEKFSEQSTYLKLCDKRFDFDRLHYAVQYLNLEEETEFDLIRLYLLKDIPLSEFQSQLKKLGRVENILEKHELSKQESPILDEEFETEHAQIFKGDNRLVDASKNKFGKPINCFLGSPPYGDKRTNGDGSEIETGHEMNGEEYGEYLANTYARYIPMMAEDASVYVIIDDYKLKNGELACSLEYFVTKMKEKGFHLVSRYTWIKTNPMPRNYDTKGMVNGIEMIYRFVLDPINYYTNPDLFSESVFQDQEKYKRQKGCTNHSKDGKTSKGGEYVQSHLKKLRNSLNEQDCINAIRGNVANPEDFFRQADEKKHTSTAPIYLTSVLILEGTKEGHLVADCWNGSGNTMVSSLLLKRLYVGIEIENDYFQQTCRRAELTEAAVLDFNNQAA